MPTDGGRAGGGRLGVALPRRAAAAEPTPWRVACAACAAPPRTSLQVTPARTSLRWAALAVYPLLSFFSPSEAYLFSFLTGSKGFSAAQLVGAVFPVWTYATFLCLPLALACSKVAGHKATVVLGAVARVSAAALVLVVPAGRVRLLQLDQACFAFFFVAKNAVLPALLFAVLEARDYQRAVSVVRTCVLVGSASSAFAGQALVSRAVALTTLARVTFWCHLAGLVASLALPAEPRRGSHPAPRAAPTAAVDRGEDDFSGSSRGLGSAGAALLSLRGAICAPHGGSRLRALLLWHVCMTAAQQLLLTYYQALFSALQAEGARGSGPRHAGGQEQWNGLVLGISHLASVPASLAAAHAPVERAVRRSTLAVAAGSSALAALLLGALGSRAPRLPAAYAAFALLQALFEFARTVGVAQIGVLLDARGCRQFLSALVCCQLCISAAQSLMQLAIQAVSAEAAQQFTALAAILALVSLALAAAAGLARWTRQRGWPDEAYKVADGLLVPARHAPTALPDEGSQAYADADLNFVPELRSGLGDGPPLRAERALAAPSTLPSAQEVPAVNDRPLDGCARENCCLR